MHKLGNVTEVGSVKPQSITGSYVNLMIFLFLLFLSGCFLSILFQTNPQFFFQTNPHIFFLISEILIKAQCSRKDQPVRVVRSPPQEPGPKTGFRVTSVAEALLSCQHRPAVPFPITQLELSAFDL